MLRLAAGCMALGLLTACVQLGAREGVSANYTPSSSCSTELTGYSLLGLPKDKKFLYKSPGPAYEKSYQDGRPSIGFAKSFLSTSTIDVMITDGYAPPKFIRHDLGTTKVEDCNFKVYDWVEGSDYGINFVSNEQTNKGISFLLRDFSEAQKAELQSYLYDFNLDFVK